MFRGRKTLQRRDRESGLSFSWRLPVSSSGSFLLATILVTCMAVALAAMVKVRIDGPPANGEIGRNSLIIVPEGEGGAWLEQLAIEAGPFPNRWNPAADPEYALLRRSALNQAIDAGVPYRIEIQDIEWKNNTNEVIDEPEISLVMPPLPDVSGNQTSEAAREVTIQGRVLRSDDGIELQHARLSLPAVDAPDVGGLKYLIEYEKSGRVLEVTPLSARGNKEVLMDWLARSQVAGHEGKPGYLVVETAIGS